MKTPRWIIPDKKLKVVMFLARHGESSEYKIRKGTRMFHSTTQKAIADLLSTGLITKLDSGGTIDRVRKYRLTFSGIVEFFHHLGDNPTLIDIPSVRNAVTTFNKHEVYPLFLECERLRMLSDVSIFHILIDTGWTLVETPPPLLFYDELGSLLVEGVSSRKRPEVRDYWKCFPESCLMYSFSFIFFTVMGRNAQIERSVNSVLLNHFEVVLGRYRDSLSQNARRIERIWDYWKMLIGGRMD